MTQKPGLPTWSERRRWPSFLAVLLGAASLLGGCAHTPGGGGQEAVSTVVATEDSEERRRAHIRLELAANYLQMGQAHIALEEVNQALLVDPGYADAYHLRGLVYMAQDDLPMAQVNLKRAQSMKPNDPDILHNLGWLHCQKQEYEQANTLFEQALSTRGYLGRAKTLLSQGMCYHRDGQAEQARNALERAYELEPGNPVIGYQLALAIFNAGNPKRAQFYIRRVNNSQYANAQSLWLGIKVERAMQDATAMGQLAEQLRKRFPQAKETATLDRGAFNE